MKVKVTLDEHRMKTVALGPSFPDGAVGSGGIAFANHLGDLASPFPT